MRRAWRCSAPCESSLRSWAMSGDDPLDDLTGSISDGDAVDWELVESSVTDEEELATVRGLRDVERVARGYRALQASPPLHSPGAGEMNGAPGGQGRAEWGDLTILELARSGASGEVWRAWDPWLQRQVALKFLQVPSGAQGRIAGDSALLDEARALARVRHPGVVAVHGVAEHEGRVGMWMEFLEGSTLASEMERRGALPPQEVARIGLDLCRALMSMEAV